MFTTQYLLSLREMYTYSSVSKMTITRIGDMYQISTDAKNRSKQKVGNINSLTHEIDAKC